MSIPTLEKRDFNVPVVEFRSTELLKIKTLYTTEDKLFARGDEGSHLIVIDRGVTVYAFDKKYVNIENNRKIYFIVYELRNPTIEDISQLVNAMLINKVIFQELPFVNLTPINFTKDIDRCIDMINQNLKTIKEECKRLETNLEAMTQGIKQATRIAEKDAITSVRNQYEYNYNTDIRYSFNNYVLPLTEMLKRFQEMKLYCEKFNTSDFKSGDPSVVVSISPRSRRDVEQFVSQHSPYKIIYVNKNE